MEKRLLILHLEDEPNDAELVRATLADLGLACEVESVASRMGFVSALERGGIDLILSDFALPGFDGSSALQIAREKVPDVPFIFVSGTLGEEAAIESLRNGATDYVLKHRLSRLAPAARRALGEAEERRKRRRAEEALHNEQQFLKALLESLEAGIVACNSEGMLTFFNRATKEFHGLPEKPIPSYDWAKYYSLYHSDGKTPIEPEAIPLYRALQGEHVRNAEIMIVPRDGPARTVLASGQPIVDAHGRKLGAVVAMHDITERKQLEAQFRQAQKMDAVGQLAGGVAHDFNNLLNIVMGYCELALAQLGAEDPMRSRVEHILKAAERAASLTRQLLAFSRKQIVEPRILDLKFLLVEMNKMLGRLIGEDIELVTLHGQDLGRVKADPGQIEQVLMNLVVNARDAMPRGGKLTVETANVDLDEAYARRHAGARPGQYVMLAVRDTGVGMDAAIQARIFEPFFTTKELGKGTGLGLATVYGIVKQSGGYIWVDSEPGRGTTFQIYLPQVAEAAQVADRREIAAPTRGSETILVVEDEEDVREMVRESLEGYGYRVLEAGELERAVEIAQGHGGPIHLLMTDVVLPRASGAEVARRLALLRPGLKVLYTSGYTDDAIVRYGVQDQGVAFLQKPYGVTTMARKVREVLDGGGTGPAPITDKTATQKAVEPMRRILLIDDDNEMRAVLREVLEGRGYQVIEAADGSIGSRIFRQQPIDLIISDIFMPGKEGLETIAELRRAFPDTKIIAMSGGISGQFYDPLPTARALGALRTFTKPFNSNELVQAVAEVLERTDRQ